MRIYKKNFDREENEMFLSKLKNIGNKNIQEKYSSHAEINSWLQMVQTANPSYLQTKEIGQTKEGRKLLTIIFDTGKTKKRQWIDCGIHAREWISPATCVWMIDSLIKDYNKNVSEVVNILKDTYIQILPVHNPDGYEYSRNTYRLWRKNRSTVSGSTCIGTDLNRNFPSHWSEPGSSTNPCSDTFHGSSAGSELETKAVVNAITGTPGVKWDSFLTFHSYGQWILISYGWKTQLPPDYADLYKLATDTANEIKKPYGTNYVSGSTANLLYLASGGSSDWAYDQNIKWSYTFELRPGQNQADSSAGFVLPEARIPAVGTETYQGLKYFLTKI